MMRLLRRSVLFVLLFVSSALAEQPRIVALSPGITELVYAAGAGDFLVGSGSWDRDNNADGVIDDVDVGAVFLVSGESGRSAGVFAVASFNGMTGEQAGDGEHLGKILYNPVNDNFSIRFQSDTGSGYIVQSALGDPATVR